MRQSMRVWSLIASCLTLSLQTPLLAATHATIKELKEHPGQFVGQTISLECYYDKESPIWVSALPDADQWIGFFVTGPPERSLTWRGEYYNLLFAPQQLQSALRTLRGGDKITLLGEGFPYQSTSFHGVGIHVQQILRGWGPSAKAIEGGQWLGMMAEAADVADDRRHAMQVTREAAIATRGKYAVRINGKRYDGLRFGDHYNFDGVEFLVDQTQ